jgi:hypothetical protein
MIQTSADFLKLEEIHTLQILDRFIVLLWWHYHQDNDAAVSFNQLCEESSKAGYPAIDKSRERKKIVADRRTTSLQSGTSFRLQPRAIKKLDEKYIHLLEERPMAKSNTIFAFADFRSTRSYIEKVIVQINVSYDMQLYDCCAVMVRRLLETLIIEIYEKEGRANELKGGDGNYMMFSGLLSYINSDPKINLGRQTKTGLDDFKRIADSSAHNRHFNATKKTIDDKIDGVKIAVVELRSRAFS